MSLARWAVVVSHVALVAVLLAMVVPSVPLVPEGSSLIVLMVTTPIVLAALIAFTLVLWLRGQHRWLVWADLATTVETFTFLWAWAIGNDWPIVLMPLAPAALALAFLVPRRAGPTAKVNS